MSYFQRLAVNTLSFISLSMLLPNNMFYVRSIVTAIVASVILSVLNTLVKPILHLLSLPITLLTFGLFSFIINGAILSLTANLLGEQSFSFSSFGTAVLVAAIMSFVNSVVINHNMGSKY
ncbi:phage holin family protein [Vagococcus intermedius]|uniref:Phage holin family protein n=1 Tax=Vagococcus intermedius TaxID=2991418 RepID=A0AAF0IA53_9ENTE|nr:phage holin family protein [Vagococcus intermedius]WEG74147.1 phage holin family protein [Vagococcus intermedius]WEG76227.1 phage holin family protein [Vagococcus intermedius]